MTVWWIIHHPIKYIKNCWIRLLSNYDIKYICTIYTRLARCLMSISRFSLRDKATPRLFMLYCIIADMAEWSRTLNIRLGDWCCSVAMVWVQNAVWFTFQTNINIYQWCELKSCREKNKYVSAQRSNNNTIWLNYQIYIYIYVKIFKDF